MSINRIFQRKFSKFVFCILSSLILLITGCSKTPMDANRPIQAEEKRKRNIAEGRGVSIGGLTKGMRGTNYEFSTSNPMWRASLEVLDFIPLTTVDYSGGIIITDWYSDNDSNERESLKISVRFLSNEIRSDSLKIVIHKKNCRTSENCSVTLLPNNTKLTSELLSVILKKASLLQRASRKKPTKK